MTRTCRIRKVSDWPHPYRTSQPFRPADRHGIRSPSPARQGTAKPPRTLQYLGGAFAMRLETLRLDPVSNETSNAGNHPTIPFGNGDHLPVPS